MISAAQLTEVQLLQREMLLTKKSITQNYETH